jgi:hypothetical protein
VRSIGVRRALAVLAITGLAGAASTAPASATPNEATAVEVTAAATSTVNTETLPFRVDSSNQAAWWKPIDLVGGVTYFAFNAPAAQASQHEVHLASRTAAGVWTEGCLRASAGAACSTFADDNGHNQPSIVVDGNGSIHAFVSMHNEQWNYFRSTVSGDVTTLVDRTAQMPDLDVDITYPVTARGPDGDAWLLVRTGTDADGAREGVLYHYDLGAGQWQREKVIAAAAGYAFYPDDLQVSSDGRVHVLWEWGPFPADPARHLGSYAVYDPATGLVRGVGGTTVATPVTPSSGGSVVWRAFGSGETIGSYTPAIQSAKLALNGTSLAGIAYRFVQKDQSAYDALFTRWTGSAWSSETLVDVSALGTDVATSAAIDVTRAGTSTRVYTVVTAQVCGELRSQAVVAEKIDGASGWTFATVGEQRLGQQRLRAETRSTDGADVVYLTAPNAAPAVVVRAGLPRSGPIGPAVPLADIVSALRGDPGGTNVAVGAAVTASSSMRADTGPELAVDGVCTDASRWISAVGDTNPSIRLALADPTALDEVRVRSGYSADTGTSAVLRAFQIQVHSAAGWTTVGSYTTNTQRLVRAAVGGTVVDEVRLLITDPSTSATDVARVFEIEAIAVE